LTRIGKSLDAMGTGPQKHSLTLRGHRTSVTLEPAFWQAFREIADEKNIAVNALAAQIDAMREPDIGLASAIRVYVLQHFRKADRD
jgi:predicted DNA-binding ribbon-helix-helix protein